MATIGAFEAKTHLPELLRRAEAGETIVVTRRGQPIAQISPIIAEASAISPSEAMAQLRAMRLPITLDELKEFRDEGRRC
ncbi:MAG: type II toxin-antitoxin system prevent-host-death family antitoxin [Candidatus Eremiobacteraeota bacterium]|nr:type II toxin-antitoxin system prevent-host-death family antitoxin [Candidatus Eremiobacteraeota bacterium]